MFGNMPLTQDYSLIVAGVSIVAIITGLVKVAREIGLPSKFAPILSVVLGVILGVTTSLYAANSIFIGIIGGIATGLAASGLYDLGKITTQGSPVGVHIFNQHTDSHNNLASEHDKMQN
jgi:hypothetical protein